MVFTEEQAKQLADYFRASSSMFYGLSTKVGRKLAYKFATRLEVNSPNSWKQTNSVQSTKQCPSSRCAFYVKASSLFLVRVIGGRRGTTVFRYVCRAVIDLDESDEETLMQGFRSLDTTNTLFIELSLIHI